MLDESDLNAADRDALERALAIMKNDPDRTDQIASMLSERPCIEVAVFAAYCRQCRALRLLPHQSPPMDAEIGRTTALAFYSIGC